MSGQLSTEPMVIGKRYTVRAVRVDRWRFEFSGWLPIVGPAHEDAEIVNFPWQHYHIDWRFAPKRVFKAASWRGPKMVYASPCMLNDTAGKPIVVEGPVLRRMTYKREPPPFPRSELGELVKGSRPDQLRAKFACARLIDGKCPHRGIPVSAMRREGDILECPGHGLRWNEITGEAA